MDKIRQAGFLHLFAHLVEANESSWKLYLIFMALCFLMAIVIFLFYPVSTLSL